MEEKTVALVGYNPIRVGVDSAQILGQADWLKDHLKERIQMSISKAGAKRFIIASHSLTSKWILEAVVDVQKQFPQIEIRVLFPFIKLANIEVPASHMEAHLKAIGALCGKNGIIDIPDASGDFADADRIQYAVDCADFAIVVTHDDDPASETGRFIGLSSAKGIRNLKIDPVEKQSAWV